MGKSEGGFMSTLSALDAFPKVNEDFFKKTMSGGVITLVASFLMALLFFSELRLYLAPQTTHELVVDTSRGAHIDINFDVTFPKMPCSWLSLDAMDISGEMHLDVASHDIKKQRLGPGGAPVSTTEVHNVQQTQKQKEIQNTTCGSCYGAENEQYKCCNTCDDVREAYQTKGWVLNNVQNIEQCKDDSYLQMVNEQQGEGCHIWGHLSVNKVAGNFHFAAGHSYQSGSMHIHDMAPFADKALALDFTHKVHSLSFGQPYPGMRNPLDGVMQLVPQKAASSQPGQKAPSGMFQYFLKVVPTDYIDKAGIRTNTNQFSVTENFRESAEPTAGGRSLPGVFFFYDLSPIKVHIQEQRASFLHFMTNVCAIVGGIFAVSGLIDGTVYQAEQVIRKKIELGKHS
ncbi:endoplasmic reticulum vesicle transporter-domain-containing protein [Scenedesmus sp. NREL 46B-D3]|nr:endoplasmic reticulum vesicle transporter-domain-containing protein [Scenedesmus sp. NREL 46B-D3]